MKILLINKFHYIQGGADRHYLELADILKEKGHEVIFMSMHYSKNIPCQQNKYFVDYLDFSKVKFNKDMFKKVRTMFWSKQAERNLEQLIKNERPDIAHLHNIYHQLSPSVIHILKKNNIPVIMTAHDYYLVSPLYSLFAKNKIFNPNKWHYWRVILNRAIKDSFGASVLSSTVNYWHRIKGYYAKVDLFISPSHFLANHIKRVYPDARVEILPNFVQKVDAGDSSVGDYYLYAGRIINEKGVDLILKTAKRLPKIKFEIAGTGPDENRLKEEYDLPNVNWLGQLSSEDLQLRIESAIACIIPSRWYENCPLAILESFVLGTPVIASHIGGIPEIVRHKYNGLLFKNNSVDSLIEQVEILNNDSNLRDLLASNARISADKYSTEDYYIKLMEMYESIR